MRRVLIGVALAVLIAVSGGAGVIVARWPTLLLSLHDTRPM